MSAHPSCQGAGQRTESQESVGLLCKLMLCRPASGTIWQSSGPGFRGCQESHWLKAMPLPRPLYLSEACSALKTAGSTGDSRASSYVLCWVGIGKCVLTFLYRAGSHRQDSPVTPAHQPQYRGWSTELRPPPGEVPFSPSHTKNTATLGWGVGR